MALFSRLSGTGLLTVILSAVTLQPLLASTNPHLGNTPAETIFHYQSRVADMMATQAVVGGTQSQAVLGAAEELGDDNTRMLLQLQTELERLLGESPAAVDSELGIDPEGWISVYHTGLVGVIQVDLASAERLVDWLVAQDLPLDRDAATPVSAGTLYPLHTGPTQPIQGYLWADADTARFLLTPAGMSRQQLVQRLENSPEGQTLADSNRVDNLIRQNQLTGSDLGWFEYAELVRQLLSPEDSHFSRDIKRFVPEYRSVMNEPETMQCREDLIALAETTPRLHWGQQSLSTDNDELNLTMHGLLALADTRLQQELTQLQGHLPADLNQADNSLFRLGLALNVDALGDALLAWRNRAINAEWECPPLVELQAELSNINMATALAGMGMLQGARGLVLELYDVDPLATDDWESVDGLLAIQADNPQRLGMIVAEALELPPGFEIPSSGESAALPMPDVSLRMRISGSYLVVYNGDQAAERARALGGIEHRSGLAAIAVDAPGLIRHLDEFPGTDTPQPATGGMDMAENCHTMMAAADLFSHMDVFQVGGWLGMEPSGMGATQSLRAHRSKLAESQIQPGRYQLAYYEDCGWVDLGEDHLTPEGQSEYVEMEDGCRIYEERYDWAAEQGVLTMHSLESRVRDSCQDTFSTWEPIGDGTLRCELVRMEADGGFQCMTEDSANSRYHYQPLD